MAIHPSISQLVGADGAIGYGPQAGVHAGQDASFNENGNFRLLADRWLTMEHFMGN